MDSADQQKVHTLRMIEQKEANPDTHYLSNIVRVGNATLTERNDNDDKVKVGAQESKKLKSLLRKRKKSSDDFADFQICN